MKVGALAVVAGALEQCGPTHKQVGEAVLVAWPVVLLVGTALQIPLLLLWRRRYGATLKLPWPHMVACFAVAASLALGVIVNRDHGYAQWVTMAICLFGASYLAFMLVGTRVWLAFDRTMPQLGGHLVAIALQIAPAAALAAGMWDEERRNPDILFIYPGYMGIVPGALFVGFLVEAWLRNRARAAPSSTPAK